MGKWKRLRNQLPFYLALALQGMLLADQSTWEHNMDVAVSAMGRQDYATSEAAFVAAVRDLELVNTSDPRLGPTINSLGLVYRAQNRLRDAEVAFRRAMFFIEKANGPESIDVGNSNLNLGSVLVAEGKFNEAEPLLKKALRIYQKQLGEQSPKYASVMAQMGEMYRNLHDYGQAEIFLKKALDVLETARGIDDPDVASTVYNLAELYAAQNLNQKAEPMFKLSMTIREATGGMESPEFAASVERYARILDKLGRTKEAELHRKLALAVKSMKKAPNKLPVPSKGAIDLIAPASHAAPANPHPLPPKTNTIAQMQ